MHLEEDAYILGKLQPPPETEENALSRRGIARSVSKAYARGSCRVFREFRELAATAAFLENLSTGGREGDCARGMT